MVRGGFVNHRGHCPCRRIIGRRTRLLPCNRREARRMKEEPFDEWDRFRKAYEKALRDRGSPGLQTEFRRLTESLGKPESTTETMNAPSKTTDGIGIPSKNQNQTLRSTVRS